MVNDALEGCAAMCFHIVSKVNFLLAILESILLYKQGGWHETNR